MGSEKQRWTGVVTNRTWAVLTTAALLVVGSEGLVALLNDGAWHWLELAAFGLGLISVVDLALRWRQI
jgi:hypothetical protein